MPNYLITGHTGSAHVTAAAQRQINAGITGVGRYVLPVGSQFAAENIGNNIIRLSDGVLRDNGADASIPAGQYVDIAVQNGTQGAKRNDLIVFRYTLDTETGIENGEFAVITGIPSSGTASDPNVVQADMLSGVVTLDEMPLYRIRMNGNTIAAIDMMFVVSSAVPWDRKINNKSLSSNVSLTAADVGALPNTLLDVVQQSYSLSCAANTYTYSSALSGLSAGHKYLILARAELSVNASGVHAVAINVNDSNLNQVRTTAQAGGGASTWAITTLPDNPQVKIRVHSPVACTVSASVAAIRIL